MQQGAIGKVEVDKDIWRLHYKERTAPVLAVSANYFVPFNHNIFYSCELTNIIKRDGCHDRKEICVLVKPKCDNGFADIDWSI